MRWCFPPDAASSWTVYWKLHSYDLMWTVYEVLKSVGAAVSPVLLRWGCHCCTVSYTDTGNPVNESVYAQFIKPLHLFRLSSVPNNFVRYTNRARQVHWNTNTGRKFLAGGEKGRASQMSFIVLLWVISASLSLLLGRVSFQPDGSHNKLLLAASAVIIYWSVSLNYAPSV